MIVYFAYIVKKLPKIKHENHKILIFVQKQILLQKKTTNINKKNRKKGKYKTKK